MEFLAGLGGLARGAAMIFGSARLWRYALIPLLINSALFACALWLAGAYFYDLIAAHIGALDPTDGSMRWLLLWIARLALIALALVTIFFLFGIVGLIIAAPFNDLLSERVELELTGALAESEASFLRRALLTIVSELKRCALIFFVWIVLLICSFAPLLGPIIFSLGAPALGALALSYEFFSLTLERRGYRFGERIGYIRGNLARSLGFGIPTLFLFATPFLNFILAPIAVAGATIMILERAPARSFEK